MTKGTKAIGSLAAVTAVVLAYALWRIANAPYESSMLLIQKIFYFRVASWAGMYCGIAVCCVASLIALFKRSPAADRWGNSAAELVVVFGLNGLISGPLWARKAWGFWWTWEPRLTISLLMWLIFVSYLLVRRFGGPGSEKLAAAVGIFGTAISPFVYVSVDIWRTIHPKTSVVPDMVMNWSKGFGAPLLVSVVGFVLLFALLLMLRIGLAERQAALDALYLAHED
ncbi:MAG TPA: cytochrome c biogenesis protein CcsA [Vicinamibacterales bacterium]|nr:cytochrome c biogenesis protein CcsA [Vicinamibacterales bacterium]